MGVFVVGEGGGGEPSMKVPPKRKGNSCRETVRPSRAMSLNESPSEKEGKYNRSFYINGHLDPQ